MLRQDFRFIKPIIFLFLILICPILNAMPKFSSIDDGVDYMDVAYQLLTPWSHIHVFKIDPNLYTIDLMSAKDIGEIATSADEFLEKSNSVIAFNGGFFDKTFHPLGLRIQQFKQTNPLKSISWWGIFYMKNNVPYITSPYEFNPSKHIQTALQVGPRLIIHNRIPSLKKGTAQRTAIGITEDKQLIVLVTDNTPLSTLELAKLLKSPPINCVDAINLDGGSSTQLKINTKKLTLSVHGFADVADAIFIQKK